MKKNKNISSKFKSLRKKHKLSFADDSTYHEKWSFKISILNISSLIAFYSVLIITLFILLVKFTPLKSIFENHVNLYELNTNLNINNQIIDSLEQTIQINAHYLSNLKHILKNEDQLDTTNLKQESLPTNFKPSFNKSYEDSILRANIENNTYGSNLLKANKVIEIEFYLPPIKGIVSKSFNSKTKHFGVDIVGQKDAPIKATLEGRIIFSNWTSTHGFVIIIQHSNELLSIYKHNSSLLKQVGDFVESGDPIAIIGNSGEYTDGPHLHFELWQNSIAIDPQEYISF